MNSSSEGQQIAECCKNYEGCRKNANKRDNCEHRCSLKVIDEFQEVYRKRMKQLNEASDNSPELSELKIRTLQDWVEDLTEQNSLLAATLEELEDEAIAKANSISRTSSDFSRALNSFHDSSFSDRKLELRESDLSQKYLGNSLNELERLKMENEELKQKYSKKEAGFEKYRMCVEKLLERVDQPMYDDSQPLKMFPGGDNQRIITHSQSFELEHLNSMLEDYKNQIRLYKEELNRKENDLNNLKVLLEEKDETLAKNAEELACLQEMAQEVDLLKAEMEENRKNFHETRMSLAIEVASKHDQNLKLKHEILLFEEQIRQSEMSTHFKDDIIKELRKELKNARCKEKNDDCINELQSKIDLLSLQLKTKNDLISQLEMKLRLEKNSANPPKVTNDEKLEELKLKLKEKENRIFELEQECAKNFSNNNVENNSVSNCESVLLPAELPANEISSSLFLEKFENYYKLSEEESIIFVNLFKENENATRLSQERENQVLSLDDKLITMSKLLNEILVLFERIEEGDLLNEAGSEDSSQNEFINQDLHHSVKLIQQNLNSVLACLNGKDFNETENCNNMLLNVEKVFEQVQSELFLLKEGYSSHKNQTEIVYEAYRKIQKSLKAFIEHIAEVTKCCAELKNQDFNEKLSDHQSKIHDLKQELHETRQKKEGTLKIVKQYLTKEDIGNQPGSHSFWEDMNTFMSLANESYSGFLTIHKDLNFILRVHPGKREDQPVQSEDSEVSQINEKISSMLDQLLSINKKMNSILENVPAFLYTPVPPLKSWTSSQKEHGESQIISDKTALKQDQETNTENEFQDFENYKICAEKLIDDLKSQITYLKKSQDNNAVTKLESKVSALEKEKEVFIKTIECQNKELMRIKQQFTITQEEKNAALNAKSIAEEELKGKTSSINEELNAKDFRIKELSSRLDQTQQCVNKLQNEIETLHFNSDYVMEKLRKDLCEITFNLKERDTLLNKREECIEALHESIRLLETENKDLRKEIDNLVKQKEKYIEFEEKLLDAQDKIMLLETEKVSSNHRAVSASDVSSSKSNRKLWSWTRFIKPSHSRNLQ